MQYTGSVMLTLTHIRTFNELEKKTWLKCNRGIIGVAPHKIQTEYQMRIHKCYTYSSAILHVWWNR